MSGYDPGSLRTPDEAEWHALREELVDRQVAFISQRIRAEEACERISFIIAQIDNLVTAKRDLAAAVARGVPPEVA